MYEMLTVVVALGWTVAIVLVTCGIMTTSHTAQNNSTTSTTSPAAVHQLKSEVSESEGEVKRRRDVHVREEV